MMRTSDELEDLDVEVRRVRHPNRDARMDRARIHRALKREAAPK